ncbi:class I SAM-dependent RNA methyltransferase [Aquidulcibacter paucihalophilus]|uniref:class I SAM-dependent RNA methyltransferase n=1 Tax=Aquidulcibacter paucihalophilus TaxID=1978549 RepID=UPI000A18AF53|nr:class I SAM-dependent RNA methyltransferase [Aquidulcibacter paucihalophilus]
MNKSIQETLTLNIEHIGARGHGVSRDQDRAVHVPFTLPGEQVEANQRGDRATLVKVLQPSKERVEVVCGHFGICGGCSLQHWAEGPYLAWKAGLVERALQRVGIDITLPPTQPAWGHGRRRATFHGKQAGPRFLFGFTQAKTHQIAPISACPVLTPGFNAAIPRLAILAEALAPKQETIDLLVTETPVGLDVDVRNAGRIDKFERKGLERLASLAEAADIGRLTLHGQTALTRVTPRVKMGQAIVELPAGAFLQATRAGEEALAAHVLKWTEGRKHVADLFAGIGTFGLRLKEKAQVRAIESDVQAVAAMKKASDGLAGGKTLTAEARDLFRAPLAPLEMKGLDAIVFDPPRAGAEAQSAQIARSKIDLVVAISCDPASFARDARILIDGGYRLAEIETFDQFRFTPHVEIAAKFVR